MSMSSEVSIRAETLSKTINYIINNKKYIKPSESSKKLGYFVSSIFMKKMLEAGIKEIESSKKSYLGGSIRILIDEPIRNFLKMFFQEWFGTDEYADFIFKVPRYLGSRNDNPIPAEHFFRNKDEYLEILSSMTANSSFSLEEKNMILTAYLFLASWENHSNFTSSFYGTKKNSYFQLTMSNVVDSESTEISKVQAYFSRANGFLTAFNRLTEEHKQKFPEVSRDIQYILSSMEEKSLRLASNIFTYEDLLKHTYFNTKNFYSRPISRNKMLYGHMERYASLLSKEQNKALFSEHLIKNYNEVLSSLDESNYVSIQIQPSLTFQNFRAAEDVSKVTPKIFDAMQALEKRPEDQEKIILKHTEEVAETTTLRDPEPTRMRVRRSPAPVPVVLTATEHHADEVPTAPVILVPTATRTPEVILTPRR